MRRDEIVFAPSAASAWPLEDSSLSAWLVSSPLCNLQDGRLRIRAMQLTQLHSNPAQKAMAVHDYVRSIPFGCMAGMDHPSATDVMRANRGDSHGKGTLLVALLRACGVPARLRFVSLPKTLYRGLADAGQDALMHAVAEIWLGNTWVQTDTYVLDSAYAHAAHRLLKKKGWRLGYGMHVSGQTDWYGHRDAFAQFSPSDPASLPLTDWGVALDPETFYSDKAHARLRMSRSARIVWMLAAPMINRNIQHVRATLATSH
jgi:hypothetical protein